MSKSLPAPYPFQHLVLSSFLFFIYMMGVKWNHVFYIIFLILSEVCILKYLLAIYVSPVDCPFIFLTHFSLLKISS